jgi:hypothetical protein
MTNLLLSIVISTCAVSILVANAIKPQIKSVNTTLDRISASVDKLISKVQS